MRPWRSNKKRVLVGYRRVGSSRGPGLALALAASDVDASGRAGFDLAHDGRDNENGKSGNGESHDGQWFE